jgi:nitrogen fixation protein FixH
MNNPVNDSPGPAMKEKPSRHLLWPILLTSLISIHIVSVAVMVTIATHDSSFAIEPDWYLKGLNYEQTARQQRENSRLGWSVKLDVGQPLSGTNQRNVSCMVFDRAGRPVKNASIDLVAFAHVRASNRTSLVLLSHDGSPYEGTLAFDDPGIWEFRLVVTRGAETFTHICTREI